MTEHTRCKKARQKTANIAFHVYVERNIKEKQFTFIVRPKEHKAITRSEMEKPGLANYI